MDLPNNDANGLRVIQRLVLRSISETVSAKGEQVNMSTITTVPSEHPTAK